MGTLRGEPAERVGAADWRVYGAENLGGAAGARLGQFDGRGVPGRRQRLDERLALGGLRYDVGPGLRYNTPIGPIRVDLGFQLNPIAGLLVNGKPETRHFRIHFSIGQAF